MRTLVSLEFNKMIRKKSFYICLILVFCYGVMLYHNRVNPLGLGFHIAAQDGTIVSGQPAIRAEKEMTDRYKGVLTDEIVWNMYCDQVKAQDALMTNALMQDVSDTYPQRVLNQFFLPYAQDSHVDGDGQSGNVRWEKEQLYQLNDIFPESAMPLQFGYSAPWSKALQSLIASMFALNLFVIIAVSPLFCEEHTFQMNALLFTSKYGRKKCFLAKITAAYLMGLAVSLGMILLHVLATLAFFGKEGLSCSIQLSEPFLFQYFADCKSVGSALFDAAALYMADILVTISLTVFASVLTSHVLTGTILSLVFFVSPYFFMMPVKMPQIILIMASIHMTSFEDILYLPDLTVGPVRIQYSYVAVVILLLIAVGFTACAYKSYKAIPEEGITWFEN